MKKLKKIASVALALVMAMALMVPAFAETIDAGNGDGSITVKNASKGEEYTIYKLFDASYNTTTKAIVYTGTIPEALEAYFEADELGYITATAAAKDANGFLNETAVKAMQDWAKTVGVSETYPSASGTADGNGLTFDNVPYGYYVVVSRSDNAQGGAISVTSTMPDAVISDKNDIDDPGFPEDGSGKVVNNKTIAVGETVTYTITYNATNWIDLDGDKSNGAEAQVNSYMFHDTLPDFLSNVTVTGVTVTEPNGTKHEIKDSITNDYPQFMENGYKRDMVIRWATKSGDDYTSLYANGSVINITYTAVVNEKVLGTDPANHKNEITGTPITNNGNGPEDKTDEDVFTGSIVIDKYAIKEDATDHSQKLAGAQFALYKMDGSKKLYCVIDDTTKVVTWTETADNATVRTTGDNGDAAFAGLAKGDYFLEERVAPAGYNKLSEDVPVTVAEATTTNVSVDQPVGNNTGAVLPSTGGMGTTIFYVLGGVLLAGSAILFVTKKRMSE